MSIPHASFQLPSGVVVDVSPGGIIGRLPDAALTLDDPRVSEAHAMVSLRGGSLLLLALRGRLWVGRSQATRVRLAPQLVVEVVPGVVLRVVEVDLPDFVYVLVDQDTAQETTLLASVHSIPAHPDQPIHTGWLDDAAACLWATGRGWRLQVDGAEPVSVEAGQSLEVAGRHLRVVARPTADAGADATAQAIAKQAPLTLITRFETAHIHVEGGPSVVVPGIAARIVTELACFGAPVPWELVARTIWKDADIFTTRRNWDRHLSLLRTRLRSAGIRDDLVRPDGRGNVEIFLRPGDEVRDES